MPKYGAGQEDSEAWSLQKDGEEVIIASYEGKNQETEKFSSWTQASKRRTEIWLIKLCA